MSFCWRLLVPPARRITQGATILAEVHAIPGPKVDPALENTGADTFHIREITQSESVNSGRDPARSLSIEPSEPGSKRTSALIIQVLPDIHHFANGNIYATT